MELIKITEKEGVSIVSAKELYEFLGSKTEFSNWCKRMFEYGFQEGVDFTPFLAESTGGRPTKDYAITIDCAKEISMLQRTEKGKQARQYFIECEKKLNSNSALMTELDLIIRSAQILQQQEKRLQAVEDEISRIKEERSENTKLLLEVKLSTEILPEISVRNQIRKCVNSYANSTRIGQQDVWHKVYEQLYYLYNISVKAYKKDKKETYLDVAERNGFLDKIYIVISNLIRELGE